MIYLDRCSLHIRRSCYEYLFYLSLLGSTPDAMAPWAHLALVTLFTPLLASPITQK